jgi:endonuclease YncB( thermonuclease family)
LQHYCRFCGTRRIGAFRYCRTCRFDFDTGAPMPDPAAVVDVETHVVALASASGSFPTRGLLAMAFIVVVGFAGLSSVAPNPESPTAAFSVAATRATPGSENLVGQAPIAAAGPDTPPAVTPPAVTPPAAAPPVVMPPAATPPAATPPVVTPPAVTPPAATPPVSASTVETLAFGPTGALTSARVIDVIDGATIVVAFGGGEHTVRYIGAEMPRSVSSGSAEEIALQALAANEALVAGRTVVLERDVSDIDRTGHLVRHVWHQNGSTWTLVNLELIRRGFAAAATHPPDTKYTDMYKAAERHARARGLGVWAKEQPEPKPKPKLNPTPRPGKSAR